MKLQFIYGDMPFWRAEVGRLALYFGDINFDDVRIKKDEFLYLKENGKLFNGISIPFHQICLDFQQYHILLDLKIIFHLECR